MTVSKHDRVTKN